MNDDYAHIETPETMVHILCECEIEQGAKQVEKRFSMQR